MSKSILFFIPARGGSKGLPGKNIKLFNKKPLIHWTIKAALESGLKGDVVVSTDSNTIAKVAIKSGATVPYLRPKNLSSDQSKSIDVLLYHLNWAAKQGIQYEYIIFLQPTSPLRTGKHIQEAFNLMRTKKASSVISVTPFEHNLNWVNTIPASGKMDNFLDKTQHHKNRQQAEKKYELNGAIYIVTKNVLLKEKTFFVKKSFAYVMNPESSVDIDTAIDFQFAAFLSKRLTK